MSNVDDKLDAAWRAVSREEPPAALDDALRAAARRAAGAGPSRARHMRSWPLAAAAVVAVLAIGIVQMTPPEQVTPTVVAENTLRQAAPREQDAIAPAAAPATQPSGPRAEPQVAATRETPATTATVDRTNNEPRKQLAQPFPVPGPAPASALAERPRAEAPGAAGSIAATTPAPHRDDDALKSKRESAPVDAPAKQARAEPFPAAPGEPRNNVDVPATVPATAAPAAADKGVPAQAGAPALGASASRSDERSSAPPVALAKVPVERDRAKDAAPLSPDEWVKLIRRLRGEGRNEEAAKELAAFRTVYKERSDALLPADLRDSK